MRAFSFAAALALCAAPALADVEGVWKTESNDEGSYLEVTVAPCAADAGLMCGTITRAHSGTGEDASQYPHLGRLIIMDMAPDGPNQWDDGRIWAPDDDETYSSNMELKGDVLNVEGCVLIICRGQDWTRVR
ncbi:MAG: DUF2147 domain-containing protein [Pseudomonadota bacterium]